MHYRKAIESGCGSRLTWTDGRPTFAKVPAVTPGFWIIKILATILGEIAGDAVSMSWLGETTQDAPNSFWRGGYLIGTVNFRATLALLVFLPVRARRFNPWLHWTIIIASTS